MSRSKWMPWVLAAGAILPSSSQAQSVSLPHSDWAMLHSVKVTVSSAGPSHGDPSDYRYAPPIPQPGIDWVVLDGGPASPRNPNDIDYLGPSDNYSSDLRSCLTELEFTDFQCFVAVPAGFVTSQATIALGPLDDGARVLVFNSAHPTGALPQDGTVAIGDSKSIDLGALLKAGENNRIVVQHVDDCGGQAWLGSVDLEVKGDAGPGAQRPTWGRLKSMYR